MRIRPSFTFRLLSGLSALASVVPLWRGHDATPALSAPPRDTADGPRPRRRNPQRVRSALRISIVEGMFAEVVTACAGGATLTAWGLYLRLPPFLLGILAALPFFAQFVQFPAAWLTSLLGHRRATLWTVSLSRQAVWPLVVLPFLHVSNAAQQRTLLAVAAASAVLGVLGNNAWVAWMGELVPPRLRGRYFGKRTALYTLGTTGAALAAGLCLDHARGRGQNDLALSGLALVACLAGGVTTLLLARQHDPAPHGSRVHLDLVSALKPFREKGSQRVLAFQMAWNAAIGISSTFFTIHMFQNLHMGFATMALYNAGLAGIRILAVPLWGRALDRLGVRPVLIACSFGIAFIPFLWLIPTPDFLWPVLAVDMLASGVLWSGHGLATFALPLAAAPRKGRPFYLAAFSTGAGMAFALASAGGGLLIQELPRETSLWGHTLLSFHWLFLSSALLRLVATGMALRLIEPGAARVEALVKLVRVGAAARLRAPVLHVADPLRLARRRRTARRQRG